MDVILLFAAGVLLGALCVRLPRFRKKPADPTIDPEQKRAAEKAMREWQNFLNYDGFPADDAGNT